MSDIPWAVAWYGDRQCVWLTATPDKDYFAISDFMKPIRARTTPLTTDSRILSDWVRPGMRGWPIFIPEFIFNKRARKIPRSVMRGMVTFRSNYSRAIGNAGKTMRPA